MALAQFDPKPFLQATSLLIDTKCQVIAWSGTSGGWHGFDHDQALCEAIESASGSHATTSLLALKDLFEGHEINEFGLLTPYTADIFRFEMDTLDKYLTWFIRSWVGIAILENLPGTQAGSWQDSDPSFRFPAIIELLLLSKLPLVP